MRDLLEGLNEQQKQGVLHTTGPMIVVAGAGSGKTTLLIRRAAHLIAQGIASHRMLIVTFTNKAASELRERLTQIIGEEGNRVEASTFHSFVLRHLIRRQKDLSNAAILDASEAKGLLKEASGMIGAGDQNTLKQANWTLNDVAAEMGLARANGLTPAHYRTTITGYDEHAEFMAVVANIWEHYASLLKRHNALDFDAILEVGLSILQNNSEARTRLQHRFEQIAIDEYQDTNKIQSAIIDILADKHKNIVVVGDVKQSIYKFRGSEIGVILGFQKTYPDARLLELTINYRSTDAIVGAANILSDAMTEKLGEKLMRAGGKLAAITQKPSLQQYRDENEEAQAIARQIGQLRDQGVSLSGIATLYRSRTIKPAIEKALMGANIPFRVIGDTSFFQRKEIRDAIALLRVTHNSADNLAWFRLIDTIKIGISAKKMKEEADMVGMSYRDILQHKSAGAGTTVKRLQKLLKAIDALTDFADNHKKGVQSALQAVWESYLKTSVEKTVATQYKKFSDEEKERLLNERYDRVNQLWDHVATELKQKSFTEMMEELLLLATEQNTGEQHDAVQLMTIHAAKGLEFDHLFLPGIEDEIIPGRALSAEEIEEEMRIFYVAMTRAKQTLSISYAEQRMMYGKTTTCEPSLFLGYIENHLDANCVAEMNGDHDLSSIYEGSNDFVY